MFNYTLEYLNNSSKLGRLIPQRTKKYEQYTYKRPRGKKRPDVKITETDKCKDVREKRTYTHTHTHTHTHKEYWQSERPHLTSHVKEIIPVEAGQ